MEGMEAKRAARRVVAWGCAQGEGGKADRTEGPFQGMMAAPLAVVDMDGTDRKNEGAKTRGRAECSWVVGAKASMPKKGA